MLTTAVKVAEGMAISTAAVYALAARGDIPSYRFGRLLRFDIAEVNAYLASCRLPKSKPQPVRVGSLNLAALLKDSASELEKSFSRLGFVQTPVISRRRQESKTA